MTTFKDLGLNSEIRKSLDELGFTEPSPIQEQAIPFILNSQNDLIALAQTGTGKTAAFGLPILQQIKANESDLQSIILCPTRELCLQISQDLKKLARYSKGIVITPVYGGERIDLQIRALKQGTDIVVGTPGRVHDLIRRKVLKLQAIRWLVLDEADEMLDMGFKDDLDAILEQTPKTRQTLLFSATMSKSVYAISKQYMNAVQEISIGEKNVGAENVSHEYYVVQSRDRFDALLRILDYLPGVYGILFCRTRRETQEVADKLKQANYNTEALHGEISQTMRTKIMDSFKRKQVRLLVATDVAARGIDVNNLSHVINYNLPDANQSYTHRSGRTGRAQNSGVAISIVNSKEVGRIKELERMVGKKIEYKKVPSGAEIYQKKIDHFLEEIGNADIQNAGEEQDFAELIARLEHIEKADLIKYVIANKFNKLIGNRQQTRDLNAGVFTPDSKSRPRTLTQDANQVNLRINLGKKNGMDVKGIFALINSQQQLKGIEIGKIVLTPRDSVFSVAKKDATEVLRYLSGAKFRGRKIEVSITDQPLQDHRERPSKKYGVKRGARPERKFNNRKRGFRRVV